MLICEHCSSRFESRNALFRHLRQDACAVGSSAFAGELVDPPSADREGCGRRPAWRLVLMIGYVGRAGWGFGRKVIWGFENVVLPYPTNFSPLRTLLALGYRGGGDAQANH